MLLPGRPQREDWRFDVSRVVPAPGPCEIAARYVAPPARPARALLVCLPGGFLDRRYFDLHLDVEGGGARRFSFAEYMAVRGWATLALDPVGVGDSTHPEDGWILDVETVAAANQAALDAAAQRLRGGSEPRLRTVGVGHSMGSCLTVAQQALYAPHAALVLFSFTTAGLPAFLEEGEAALANDPERARAHAAELARKRFGAAYPSAPNAPDAGTGAAFSVGSAPPEAKAALEAAATNLLPIPGLLSMIPGGYRPWADEVRVPSFVAVGDHDLHGAHEAPGMLPNAPEAVAYTLDDCWHCHHVANTRERLWKRIDAWLGAVLEPRD